MVRVLVTGDRHWAAINVATVVLSRLGRRYGDNHVTVVHGDVSGVDAAFDEMARAMRIAVEPHPANWKELGRRAGPMRNQEMVDAGASFAIACHRTLGRSKGTRDCVTRCLAAGIPVYLVADNNVEVVQVLGFDGAEVILRDNSCARSAAS